METLGRINSTFENVRNAIKVKKSSELVQHLRKDIQSLSYDLVSFGKENHNEFVRSLAMEGLLALLSAKTLPLPLPEKRNVLQVAFDKLKPFALREECLFVFLRIQNLLCYFLIQLDQIILAQNILENMESLYDEISKGQTNEYIDAEDLFAAEPLNKVKKIKPEKIDKIITNNIQMQAFLYNKLNMPEKYTVYNHTALRRQLELKEGSPQEWALRAARLGNYLTFLQRLGDARHHLAAAYLVLRTCRENGKLAPDELRCQLPPAPAPAHLEMHFLELSHHWVKYGLTLFKMSKKKILSSCFTQSKADLWKTVDILDDNSESFSMKDENVKDVGSEKNSHGDYTPDKLFEFPSLNVKEVESKVPLELVSKALEARKLFNFTNKWLMRAKRYYDMEHHSAQYIACSLQLTELYEHLAFFERDVERQYGAQRRRAEVLEGLSSLLKSGDHVTSVHIDVIRELSQVQLELMALNLQRLWREESQTNVCNLDTDTESVANSLASAPSNGTLTKRTLNVSSKSMFLKKMEAVTSINGKLFRLSGQLSPSTPSRLSLDTAN